MNKRIKRKFGASTMLHSVPPKKVSIDGKEYEHMGRGIEPADHHIGVPRNRIYASPYYPDIPTRAERQARRDYFRLLAVSTAKSNAEADDTEQLPKKAEHEVRK
jgi:hypothetical protein